MLRSTNFLSENKYDLIIFKNEKANKTQSSVGLFDNSKIRAHNVKAMLESNIDYSILISNSKLTKKRMTY